jgi:hypothetical protein
MYTHVSKCKNDKIKERKKSRLTTSGAEKNYAKEETHLCVRSSVIQIWIKVVSRAKFSSFMVTKKISLQRFPWF